MLFSQNKSSELEWMKQELAKLIRLHSLYVIGLFTLYSLWRFLYTTVYKNRHRPF